MTQPTPVPNDLPTQVVVRLQGMGVHADAAQVARWTKALNRLAQTQPQAIDPACHDFLAVLQRCRHA